MPTTLTLLGISGSLRRHSHNTVLLRACQELAPADVEVVIRRLHDVPLYDRDLEEHGFPAPVRELREAIGAADGLLLATPEYNRSVSGVLKNAIDWVSRGKDSPLEDRPTAVLSAAGRGGGRRAQAHLTEILEHKRVDLLAPTVCIPRAWEHIDDGRLVTETYRREVAALLTACRARILEQRAETTG